MRFVIITGMSGGGKSTAMKMLEDMGFYCVDNLPVPLLEQFVNLMSMPGNEIGKVALGLDVRTDQSFLGISKTLDHLKELGHGFELLFLDSADPILVKRYKETRRMHPLSAGGTIEEGILKERKVLSEVKKKANYIIDTTNLLTRQLRTEMERIFVKEEEYNNLMIHIRSFGFKHGIPSDADLVFDVRFLPNPFYLDDLRMKTGNDKEVQDYVMSFQEAGQFLEKLTDMVEFLIPNYVKEGKYQLVIGIGCTGGKHRSVTLANALYDRLNNKGTYGLVLNHRDVSM